MKNLIKAILTIALFTACYNARAQYYSDIEGRPLKEYKADDADGSPYLITNWAIGTATVDKGMYKDMKLKYDMKTDQVVFAGKDDVPMSFAEPVKKFTINEHVFANGFPAIGSQVAGSYYEVLSDGATKLLKRQVKHIQETKSYGSTTVSRQYVEMDSYYVLKDGKMIVVKPDKKSILAVMSDKADKMNAYLAANKVNFKNDVELGKLFDQYNSL